MKTIYEINEDKGWRETNKVEIEAVRPFKIPGIRCPSCGVWATTGIIYPSAHLPSSRHLSSEPLSVDEFKTLAARIQPLLNHPGPLKPGTDLGPLRGKAKGNFGDIVWPNPWTILIRRSVFSSLKESGIKLVGIPAELDFESEPCEELIEIEVPAIAHLQPSQIPRPCGICGRIALKRPQNIIIDQSSFDETIHVQRVAELPTILVVTEDFAQLIRRQKLCGARLSPPT